jgi:hypothetical protein
LAHAGQVVTAIERGLDRLAKGMENIKTIVVLVIGLLVLVGAISVARSGSGPTVATAGDTTDSGPGGPDPSTSDAALSASTLPRSSRCFGEALSPPTLIAFSSDGSLVAASGDGRVLIARGDCDATAASPVSIEAKATAIAFSADASQLYIGTGNGNMLRIATATFSLVGTPIAAHDGEITDIVASASGTIYSGSTDAMVRRWSADLDPMPWSDREAVPVDAPVQNMALGGDSDKAAIALVTTSGTATFIEAASGDADPQSWSCDFTSVAASAQRLYLIGRGACYRILDPVTLEPIATPPSFEEFLMLSGTPRPGASAVTVNSKDLVVVARHPEQGDDIVGIWDEAREAVYSEPQQGRIYDAVLAPNGDVVAWVDGNENVQRLSRP